MAKQRRVTDARSPKKKIADRSRRAETPRRAAAVAIMPSPAASQPPPQPPSVVVKKPAYTRRSPSTRLVFGLCKSMISSRQLNSFGR